RFFLQKQWPSIIKLSRFTSRSFSTRVEARISEAVLTNVLRFPYHVLAIRNRASANLYCAMKSVCVVLLGCSVSLFAQSVDYKPAPSSPLSIPGGGHSFVAGDVNKDGHIDLVVAENNKLSVMLGDGKGGFSAAPVPPTPVTGVAGEMLLADFNHDGV